MAIDSTEILAKTDLVSLISEVVELRPRKGNSGEMVGLCPFHQDSSPSFEVNASKGVYACWSCSAGLGQSRGGSALTFVQRYYEMSFVEALTFLARRAGIDVPYPTSNKVANALSAIEDPAVQARKKALASLAQESASRTPRDSDPQPVADIAPLIDALKIAEDFYHASLFAHPAALEYVQKVRGISQQIIHKYGIGFAPSGFSNLGAAYPKSWIGQHPRALIDAGLSRLSEKGRPYDFFRDRITFPVRDAQGKTRGFGARRTSDQDIFDAAGQKIRVPKYLNSPETSAFIKNEILFGFHEARTGIERTKTVIIVEGYMDVLALANSGVTNAVAVMGVSLSEKHVELLQTLATTVVICMDGDSAGVTASMRAIQALAPHVGHAKDSERSLEVKFLELPSIDPAHSNKVDPDAYVSHHGKAAFEQLVARAKPLAAYWEDTWQQTLTVAEPSERDALVQQAQSVLRNIKPRMKSATLFESMESTIHSHAKTLGIKLVGARNTRDTVTNAEVVQKDQPNQDVKLDTQIAHEASDRLRHACMLFPEVARAQRPQLIALQKSASAEALVDAVLWVARYDHAIVAGESLPASANLHSAELNTHSRVLLAAPSIFSHYLDAVTRARLSQAHCAGKVSDQEYLTRLDRHSGCKP